MLKLDQIQNAMRTRYPDPIMTIDSHTQGEPTRLLISGTGALPGTTIKAKRDYFESHYDHIRMLLTREPRGHRDILAAVLTEPVSPEAQFGLFYMDARRYPYLCGHATIGAVTTLIEVGGLSAADGQTIVTIDTPSGPQHAHCQVQEGRVTSVAIEMVPSFVFDTGCELEIAGFGNLHVDLVCVGGFFAMVAGADIGIALIPENSHKLITLGMAIIEGVNQSLTVYHPERPEVKTVDVVEFYDEDVHTGTGKGFVVYGEAHMDRSPCGTGTAAKMTLLHHHGQLAVDQVYKNASPLGTVFEGQILRTQPIGNFDGIVAQIRGNAQITGYHQFVLDTDDPFQRGFLI